MSAHSAWRDPHFAPLAQHDGDVLVRHPAFQRAAQSFEQVMATRPYRSSSSGHLCVTVSIHFARASEHVVLCGDIDWGEDLPG